LQLTACSLAAHPLVHLGLANSGQSTPESKTANSGG
jgi:hypothetical protein